ncbi:MAG: glycosyltransferase family 2 protein [Acidimicrobiia bacterium]|nr:glycosyltransferase family 2 protein [Acidimicrobiia bacterium]
MNHSSTDRQALRLSVVIPAYNEKQRIVPTIGAFTAQLAAAGVPWELIIADDGSTDETVALVEMLQAQNVRVLSTGQNGGKGSAVRRGVDAAGGELILFADADCSTPVAELAALTAAIEAGADLAVGSRSALGAEVEHRSALRRLLTFGLRAIVRVGLGIPVDDTQCGFKLFRREVAKELFAAQTIDGFSFDLEILFLAARRRLQIAEVPVRWFDAPGSKVDTRREIVRFLRSVVQIRWNALRGVYSHA